MMIRFAHRALKILSDLNQVALIFLITNLNQAKVLELQNGEEIEPNQISPIDSSFRITRAEMKPSSGMYSSPHFKGIVFVSP